MQQEVSPHQCQCLLYCVGEIIASIGCLCCLGNVDFSEGPSQMLLVAPAETRACFNIAIIDDKIIELDELFQVVITSPTGQEGLESEEFKPVQVELNVTISDDDGMCTYV